MSRFACYIYIPSTIPPMLDTPFTRAVTPAPRPLPSRSPKFVVTGPVNMESDPQFPIPIITKHVPTGRKNRYY